jgi:hypothetical protein
VPVVEVMQDARHPVAATRLSPSTTAGKNTMPAIVTGKKSGSPKMTEREDGQTRVRGQRTVSIVGGKGGSIRKGTAPSREEGILAQKIVEKTFTMTVGKVFAKERGRPRTMQEEKMKG